MENQTKVASQQRICELLRANRLVILLEIFLVLAPTYLSLILGYRPEGDFIAIGENLILVADRLSMQVCASVYLCFGYQPGSGTPPGERLA